MVFNRYLEFAMTRTRAVIFMMLLQSFGPLFANCSNPGYILKEATYIPRNYKEYLEMNKHLECKSIDQKIVYLLDSSEEKTLVGCFREEYIFGKYCPEYNTGKAQARFNAPCAHFTLTPCSSPYNLSESYLYFECYEKFGAILSPERSQQELKKRENFMRDIIYILNMNENLILAISISFTFVFILVIVHCLFFLFLIRKFIYKENITYKDFFQSQNILFAKLLFNTSTVSDNRNPDTGSDGAERVDNVAKNMVPYTIPPVNPNPGPPVYPESETSPLHTTGNINNSSELHTNHNEDPPVTEEDHVDTADTVPPVSNPGPLEYPYTVPPVSNIGPPEYPYTVPPVSNIGPPEYPYTVPPVSNPGPPVYPDSELSPLLITGNINNFFEMHTKQNEDPPVTEEGHVEVETRETVGFPEYPDEQENTGMDVILDLD